MKDKLYRVVINPNNGKEILEPLCDMDILKIADEIKKHIKGSERPGTT